MIQCEVTSVSPERISVRLTGALIHGEEASQVRNWLRPLAERFQHVVVDLSSLARIDSTGVGELVMAHAAAGAGGHELQVVNAAGTVREVLLLVKLLTVLGPGEAAA